MQSQPMERLATIPEITEARADATAGVAIQTNQPPISPSIIPLASTLPQSRPFLTPIVPTTTQSGNGSTTFKDYVEQTIARMHAPPQEPPIERSCMATPSIPIQTMTVGTVGNARHTLEATATSAPTMPQDARIGGLKLEMLEKYIGSRIPAVSSWLIKIEWYFKLMKYPTDISADGVATRVTDAAQAWLDKELQDLQLGRRNPGPVGQTSAVKWSRPSPPCPKWSMREGS